MTQYIENTDISFPRPIYRTISLKKILHYSMYRDILYMS